jgi:hypothetical protein
MGKSDYKLTKKIAQSNEAVRRQKEAAAAKKASDAARAGNAEPTLKSGEDDTLADFKTIARKRGAGRKDINVALRANQNAVLDGEPVLHGKRNLSRDDRQATAIGRKFATDKIRDDISIKGGPSVIRASKQAGTEARKTILAWGIDKIADLFDVVVSDPQRDRSVSQEVEDDQLIQDWEIRHKDYEPEDKGFWHKVFNPTHTIENRDEWDASAAPAAPKEDLPIRLQRFIDEEPKEPEEKGFWHKVFNPTHTIENRDEWDN